MVDGDRAAVQFTMEGTHTGPLRGFTPTRNIVRLPICTVLRVEAGLIAEIWYYANLYVPLVGTLMSAPGWGPACVRWRGFRHSGSAAGSDE